MLTKMNSLSSTKVDPYLLQLILYTAAARNELSTRKANAGDMLAQYGTDPVAFITEGLGQFREPSWRMWRLVLRAAYGQGSSFDEEELELFQKIAGPRRPPAKRVKELWAVVGRRGGKDSVASTIALNAARFADCVALRPGERALIPCFATDRDQAGIVFNYIRGYFEVIPRLERWLAEELPTSYRSGPIMLTNRTDIRVVTNNFRAPRGRAIPCAIFDECAFYRSEESANPDIETYRAVLGGTGMSPDALIVGISSPHKRSGLLYDKYDKHFGADDDDILVIQAATRIMNPMIDEINPGLIDKAMEDDPDLAEAEYFAQFRKDLEDYVSRETVVALTPRGIHEVPRIDNVEYVAFVDPSGGSQDSFTAAIAHNTGERTADLDCVVEVRSPHHPEEAVATIAETLERYGITKVKGDRYAGTWPSDAFMHHGISYEPSELTKSDIYREFLPVLNSHRCKLLDIPRLITQLLSLERRTVRGGRDSIDHPKNGRDDVINSAAGAIVEAATDPLQVWDRLAR